MPGTLYLVGTPIGNLEDITLRALRVLREVDLIACEDTRTSAALLRSYEIETPTTSYHKYNEAAKSAELLAKLLKGDSIALITDAGMPAISDPGEILVRLCMENHVAVTAVPGPSACVTALSMSGSDTRRFVYEGFLPQDNKEKKEALSRLANETRTIVFYEAPHRLLRTLKTLGDALGMDRPISLCRELTKIYEEVWRTTFGEAITEFETDEGRNPRGEYVLVIDGKNKKTLAAEEAARWEQMDITEHVALYEKQGLDHKSAMKAVAADRGISRRDVYQALLEKHPDDE